MNNKFVILVTFRNVERYIFNCLQSIKEQDYGNYKVILCNDVSDDKTVEVVDKFIKGLSPKIKQRFFILDNKIQKWKIGNLIAGIQLYKDMNNFDLINFHGLENFTITNESIVVILDGDDWFANGSVLSKLNQVYNDTQCSMTYGSYMEFPAMIRGKFSKKLAPEVISQKLYKKIEWSTSHLVSFKIKLWDNIPQEYFVDWNNEPIKFAPDVATILPMLELAGDKIQFIEDILYVYNADNPLNEHKVNADLQQRSEHWVRTKKVLDTLC
mgnify:CR=1 FL=1